MCRMLAFHVLGPGRGLASELVQLLPKAASDDKYERELGGDGRHCHGYGYILVYRRSPRSGWLLSYERGDSYNPEDLEAGCEENLKGVREAASRVASIVETAVEAYLIFHARRTEGEPRGAVHAHPFRENASLEGGLGEVFLAHNGSVDKIALASSRGFASPKIYTDSHLVLKALAEDLKGARLEDIEGRLKASIEGLKGYTRTALDLLIMMITPTSTPRLWAYGYVRPGLSGVAREYYRPIVIVGDGIKAYVSSTIRDLMGRMPGIAEKHIDGHLEPLVVSSLG
ncbi:MAG: hypothetical protein F7C09_05270 [Aeropyrum sp.]|nr:hypothetical protein [Aeropyrum sp.]